MTSPVPYEGEGREELGVAPVPVAALAGEEWRPVPGYEGLYSVSSLGRIQSAYRDKRFLSSKGRDEHGYPVVSLTKQGKRHTYTLHRLVCRAFNGEPASPDLETAHLDGCRDNPCASNLAWATKVENQSHKKLHGTHLYGERNPHSKLTEARAAAIIASRGKVEAKDLAARYGVATATVQEIWRGKRWPHLQTATPRTGNRQVTPFPDHILREEDVARFEALAETVRARIELALATTDFPSTVTMAKRYLADLHATARHVSAGGDYGAAVAGAALSTWGPNGHGPAIDGLVTSALHHGKPWRQRWDAARDAERANLKPSRRAA